MHAYLDPLRTAHDCGTQKTGRIGTRRRSARVPFDVAASLSPVTTNIAADRTTDEREIEGFGPHTAIKALIAV
jgi:hypothetical protein